MFVRTYLYLNTHAEHSQIIAMLLVMMMMTTMKVTRFDHSQSAGLLSLSTILPRAPVSSFNAYYGSMGPMMGLTRPWTIRTTIKYFKH